MQKNKNRYKEILSLLLLINITESFFKKYEIKLKNPLTLKNYYIFLLIFFSKKCNFIKSLMELSTLINCLGNKHTLYSYEKSCRG